MPNLDEISWALIIDNIKDDICVPFLGAGASLGFEGKEGLPTAGQLAETLAAECEYPGPDRWDLLRVGQYFVTVKDPDRLRRSIRAQLNRPNVKPSRVHAAIAALPFSCVLTTNYDNLMETAFREAGKFPTCEVYSRKGDAKALDKNYTKKEPLVYKLHGSIDVMDTMVATEDDVVDFLACLLRQNPPLPSQIKTLITTSSMLFIGYGLKDWNVRAMLRALRSGGNSGSPDLSSFAIQKRPADQHEALIWDMSVLYFDKKESLRCFNVDAVEFATELKERYENA
jgi:hypothetical protein